VSPFLPSGLPYPPLIKASRGAKSGGQRFMTILPEKIFWEKPENQVFILILVK